MNTIMPPRPRPTLTTKQHGAMRVLINFLQKRPVRLSQSAITGRLCPRIHLLRH
jgi:hypothetical protein